MELYFLGTCSGTEPMPDMNHVSFAIKKDEKLYFFDAGENCARTAHLMGLDLLSIKNVFISHTHMDHVGGLATLLWHIRKLTKVKKTNPRFGDINVFIPNLETFDGVWKILKNTEGNFACDYAMQPTKVKDGVIFDDGNLKVTAFHNHHLQQTEDVTDWLSFSYRIECEGKSIVYSGDVFNYTDLDVVIGDYADLLIIETGHNGVDKVYEYTKNKNLGRVCFNHHGREIINNPVQSEQKVKDYFKGKAQILRDRTIIEL